MSLQIYIGPMFAGKSSEILRIVNRYKAIGWPICSISYTGDNRYTSEDILMNHDQQGVQCIKSSSFETVYKNLQYQEAKLVIIDEAQFFADLKGFALYTVEVLKKDLVIVGLDGDADRKPFGEILDCIPIADDVFKLKSFCKLCGDGQEALFSFCQTVKKEQVCVGGAEMYIPLCRMHYLKESMIRDYSLNL